MRAGKEIGSPIAWSRVPRFSAMLWATVAHVILMPLVIWYLHPGKVRLVRPKREVTELIPPRDPLPYRAEAAVPAKGAEAKAQGRRLRFRMVNPVAKAALPVGGELTLGEKARRMTSDMLANLRFSMIYGFTTGPAYRLAVQRQGQIPRIARHEVPYEQYVIIEVTIDEAGKVAEARMTAGTIPQEVQQKLVSAIREFEYEPATRDGSPIPSLLDIVIHVPS